MKHHFPTQIRALGTSLPRWSLVACAFGGTLLLGLTVMAFRSGGNMAACLLVIESSEEALSLELPNGLGFDSRQFFKEQASVIGGEIFLMRVAAQKGLAKRWGKSHAGTYAQLQRSTQVQRGGKNEIKIRYRSVAAAEAVELANAIAEAYLLYWASLNTDRYGEKLRVLVADYEKFRALVNVKVTAFDVLNAAETSEQDLRSAKQELISLQRENARMEGEIKSLKAEKEWVLSAARIRERASPASTRRISGVSSTGPLVLFMASLAAIMTGGFVFRKKLTKPRTAALARAVGTQNLVLLPRDDHSFLSGRKAAFQRICGTVLTRFPRPEGVVVTVLPCLEGESAADLCGNIARTFAEQGYLILLLEGNLREPQIHESFGASSHPGLSDYLRGEMGLTECVVKTRLGNLWVMPGGTGQGESVQLLESDEMKTLLDDAKSRFDILILNGPSIIKGVDSLVLAELSHLTYLCTEVGQATREMLAKTRCAIDQAGGKFGGLIVTSVESEDVESSIAIGWQLAGKEEG